MLQVLNPGQSPPVYDDVPEFWKQPFNRYFPIPAGFPFAGSFMYVDFRNQEPWKKLAGGGPTQEEILLGGKPKPGFIETHGSIPTDSRDRRIWADAHKWFKAAGLPEDLAADATVAAMIEASNQAAAQWNLTDGKVYQGRYGVMVRFPKSVLFDFEVSLHLWVISVDNAISTYQKDAAIYKKHKPENWHPFVPESIRALV